MEINADFRAKMWTDTEANWLASDPVPLAGEIILTSDKNEMRFGDNVKKYSELDAISGGGIGTLSVPQPKTWVSKFNDYSNISDLTNQWDSGLFKYVFQVSTGVEMFTGSFNLNKDELSAGDKVYGSHHITTTGNRLRFMYDYDTDTFKIDENTASTYYIAELSIWELDPDNVALVTVPSDPSLIKDWVEVYENLTNTDQQTTLPVADGRYEVLVHDDATKAIIYTCEVVIDNGLTTCKTPWAEADNLSYTVSTGVWDTHDAAWAIRRIRRWEDVAGADAQMNPPVDGWENKFDNDLSTGNIVNNWGIGWFRVHVKYSGGYKSSIINLPALTSDVFGAAVASDGASSLKYLTATNEFNYATSGSEIVKIDKFNSLVNVLHAYHPDPRQVAQKDWVAVYDEPANTGNVLNIWGTGTFIFYSKLSSGAAGTCVLQLDDLNQTTYSAAPDTTAYRVSWNFATNTFIPAGATYEIIKILKWEDSQASDAPRAVLDDGWELIYDVPANTAAVPWTYGLGRFWIEAYETAPAAWHGTELKIPDLTIDCLSACTAGATTDGRFWYSQAGVTVDCKFTTYNIKKIWRFTGQLTINAQYNVTSLSDGPNQVCSINTDAGDVNKTLPSSPSLGGLYEVWNTGSNGYHVNITTDGSILYNGLAIGDRKGIRLRYVDGWKYEDVIIDEYTDTTPTDGSMIVRKWSGGKMAVIIQKTSASTATVTWTYPEVMTSVECYTGTSEGLAATAYQHSYVNLGVTSVDSINRATNGTSVIDKPYRAKVEGRWKTGV